jgi:hypothetical protein
MAMSSNNVDREYKKFVETALGETAVRTKVDEIINSWTAQVVGRKITATYPTSSTEVYTYTQNTDTIMVLLVTYTDSTKEVFTSVERTA